MTHPSRFFSALSLSKKKKKDGKNLKSSRGEALQPAYIVNHHECNQ